MTWVRVAFVLAMAGCGGASGGAGASAAAAESPAPAQAQAQAQAAVSEPAGEQAAGRAARREPVDIASFEFEPPSGMRFYYLAILRRGPAWTAEQSEETRRLGEGHMANIERLAREGTLVLAGPFLDSEGGGDLAGIFVLEVPSLEAARAALASDPRSWPVASRSSCAPGWRATGSAPTRSCRREAARRRRSRRCAGRRARSGRSRSSSMRARWRDPRGCAPRPPPRPGAGRARFCDA
ncbi:MAG TPA: YciI family protein [Kofleriaceae bacterium]|nr:YciI family protein [Kofleriaceae bacterium]